MGLLNKIILTSMMLSPIVALAATTAMACPTTNAIKHVELSQAIYFWEGYYITQISHYDTPQQWGFTLGPFPSAQSPQDAIRRANEVLQTLGGTPHPEYGVEESTACVYTVAGPYNAMAFEPVISYSFIRSKYS